jgi:hypothetical protein
MKRTQEICLQNKKLNSMEKLLKWSVENSDPNGGPPQPPPQDDPEKKKIVNLFYLKNKFVINLIYIYILILGFGNYRHDLRKK